MLMCSAAYACFEHSNFLMVTRIQSEDCIQKTPNRITHPKTGHGQKIKNPNTNFLTAATLAFTSRAIITAAAGNGLSLYSLLKSIINLFSFNRAIKAPNVLLVPVSNTVDWTGCATAAVHGRDRRF